ncbi:MAG: hypothetical protein RSF75_01245 [Acidaminococcaceae bacterium]
MRKGEKMTIQNNITKNIYIGNGSTKIFPYRFQLNANHPEYVKVYITDSEGNTTETTNFSINTETQEIMYPITGTALMFGYKITITRILPLQQLLNLINGGAYFAEDIETALDDLVCMLQQLEENISRSLVLPVSASNTIRTNLPSPEPLHCFRWSADGKKLESTLDPATTLANVTALAMSASESKVAAAQSENNAKVSEVSASVSTTKAEQSAEIAISKATAAATSANAAATSEQNAAATSANESAKSLMTATVEADRAKAEADKAASIVGGDYISRTEASKVALSGSYTDLLNVPRDFIPSVHRHDASEITNLPTCVLLSDVGNIAGKIPKYTADGHLMLPDGTEIWVAPGGGGV